MTFTAVLPWGGVVSRPKHNTHITHGRIPQFESHQMAIKYHVGFIPKYRRRTLFGVVRRELGPVFRRLAEQKESRIEEGHTVSDFPPAPVALRLYPLETSPRQAPRSWPRVPVLWQGRAHGRVPAPVILERLDLALHREMRREEMIGLLMRRLLSLFALFLPCSRSRRSTPRNLFSKQLRSGEA